MSTKIDIHAEDEGFRIEFTRETGKEIIVSAVCVSPLSKLRMDFLYSTRMSKTIATQLNATTFNDAIDLSAKAVRDPSLLLGKLKLPPPNHRMA